jgi:hypothetical protein
VSILGHFQQRVIACRRGLAGTLAACIAMIGGASFAKAGEPSQARPALARSGSLIDYEPRPILPRELRACSFRHPLCVHGAGLGGTTRDRHVEVLALLDAADRAWDVATGALLLPPPETDVSSSGALDLYLVDGEPYASRTRLDLRDPRAGFDRSSAFALVGRGVAPGCALDATAARVVARAILFGVAPATDEGSALAESTSMGRLMVPCATRPTEATRLFQSHPELGLADTLARPDESIEPPAPRLVTTPSEQYASGASLFYDWVDDSFGGYPSAVVRAIWAMSPTVTPPGAARWNDEPDGFEVLRTSFKGALTTGSTVDDLWLDFAVARAFVPEYPVRTEWSVEWPKAPRTLGSGPGVAPTGAAYVSIDCANRPTGARLRFEARWEEHARMLWTLVRVDGRGLEMSRVNVPEMDRGTEAQMSLVDLDGVARVLVVASNAGDPLYPFDPDDYIWEPHGWVVSLASE